MKYPCIPVWMKEREKDPFDYPLRSKKELAFEQYMFPPMFGMKMITNDYKVISNNKTYAVHKADNRNNIAKIELNFQEMNLSPLQKQRMIFLLGPRYKKNSKTFKIVCRQYTKWEHNIARTIDIFRQLYWEAKRAPIYYLPIMKSKQRRSFRDKILGKNLTPAERQEKIKELNKTMEEGQAEFDKLWDSGTYGKEHLMKKMEVVLKEHYKGVRGVGSAEEQLSSEKAEDMLKRENIEKELVKKRVLTQKAYETFYGKNAADDYASEDADKVKN
jgi:hypothetical protein